MKTHGQTGTSLYYAWVGMKTRCYNRNKPSWHRYGGRGIKVCKRWLDSFEHFAADMGQRPGPGYSLDRIDNDKDYTKSNCKWSTTLEQQRNKYNNVRLYLYGKPVIASDLAKLAQVDKGTIANRLREGLSPEQIVALKKWTRRAKQTCIACGQETGSNLKCGRCKATLGMRQYKERVRARTSTFLP